MGKIKLKTPVFITLSFGKYADGIVVGWDKQKGYLCLVNNRKVWVPENRIQPKSDVEF